MASFGSPERHNNSRLSLYFNLWVFWNPSLHFIIQSCWLFTIYKKFPENPVGNEFFWSFRRGISGSNGISGKVVLFFRTECSQRNFFKFVFFSELSLTSVSGLRGRFTERESNCTNVKTRFRGKFFSVPNFAHHLPKPWTDWFARVDGKHTVNSTTLCWYPWFFVPLLISCVLKSYVGTLQKENMCLLYHSAGDDQESWNSGTLFPRPEQVLRCWELKHLFPGFQNTKARKLVSWYMFQRFLYPIFLVCGRGFLSCHTLSDFVVQLHLIDDIESLPLNGGNDKHFQIVNVVKAKELYPMLFNSSFLLWWYLEHLWKKNWIICRAGISPVVSSSLNLTK